MTRDKYMDQLAKALRWKCGQKQAAVILKDYNQAFQNGAAQGRDEETLCKEFGAPRMAARALLREDRTPVWAIPLVRLLLFTAVIFSLAALWFGDCLMDKDTGYWALLILPGTVYIAFGKRPERISGKRGLKALCLSLYAAGFLCLAAACICLQHAAALHNVHLTAAQWSEGAPWRNMANGILHMTGVFSAAAVLGGWLLSLRVFPGSVFAVFGAFSIGLAAQTLNYLHLTNDLGGISYGYAASLVLFGLALAILFSYLMRVLPRCADPCPEAGRAARVGAVVSDPVRGLFLENLSHHLKFKFTRWERYEILEDYAEAFEIGLREGQSAETLCDGFGGPEAIAAILVMERRGRFLAFPAVKLIALAALFGFIALLYCRADWLNGFPPLRMWAAGILVAVLPLLALLAMGGKPVWKGGAKRLSALYLCAFPMLMFFPMILLDMFFEWDVFPVMSGAPCMAALFAGLALIGAVTFLELRVYPMGAGRLPLLFINAGYLVTNAELGDLLRSLTDPASIVPLLIESFIPLVLGLILALISHFALRRPGMGEKLGVPAVRGEERKGGIERVRRVSRTLAMA